jgi:hypothetical protein
MDLDGRRAGGGYDLSFGYGEREDIGDVGCGGLAGVSIVG